MLYKVTTAILSELPFGGLITSLLDCIKDGKEKGEAVDEKLRVLDEGLSDWVKSIEVANNVQTMVENFREDVRKKKQDRKEHGEEASSDRNDNDRTVVNDAIDHFKQGFEPSQSAILGNLFERIEHAKSSASTIDDLLSELYNVLTEWLEAVIGYNAMNPIGELQSTIEELHKFVRETKVKRGSTRKRDQILKLHHKDTDNEDVDREISASMQKIQFSVYRLIASTFLLASQTHVEVVHIGKVVDEMHDTVNETSNTVNETNDTVKEMNDMLHELVQKFGLQGMDQSLLSDPLDVHVIVKILDLLSDGDTDAAMGLVRSMKPETALKVVKEFLRLRTSDDVKRMGLIILDNLLDLQDQKLCCRAIDVALILVMELVRDVNNCDDEVKERASEVLEKMAEKYKETFFECLRKLSRDEKSQQVIVEAHLIRLIINCAKAVVHENDGCARSIFEVLLALTESKNSICHIAIAQVNGISTLVEIYRATDELLEQAQADERETLQETSVQTVEVLAHLSYNKECEPHFATGRAIWPFVHCLSEIHSSNWPYIWVGNPVEAKLKPSDYYTRPSRYIAAAGGALLQLSLNNEHKAMLTSLSTLFRRSIRDIRQFVDEEFAANRFADLWQWTHQYSEAQRAIKAWEVRLKNEFLVLFERNDIIPEISLYQGLSNWLQHVSWSLAFDDDTGLTVAECWYQTNFKVDAENTDDYQSFRELFFCTGDLRYWIKTVLKHLDLYEEKKNWVDFSSFLDFLVEKLEGNNATNMQKGRTVKVLWYCSFEVSAGISMFDDGLAKLCKTIVDTATDDEMEQIFWATGILANLTWIRATPKDYANAATRGAQCIMEIGPRKFRFLAQYVADHDIGYTHLH